MPEIKRRHTLSFALSALATWRFTHLLVEEDGPGDVRFARSLEPSTDLFRRPLRGSDCHHQSEKECC
jgi:hypothetical protein